MVASIRNISAKGVTVGQYVAPPPPPPPGIHLRSTSGTMTYWGTYATAYPGLTDATGTFDPAALGANGVLSNSNLTVEFSGISSTFGTATVGSLQAWEFLVGSSYGINLGYWADGLGSQSANNDDANGGNNGGQYYRSDGAAARYGDYVDMLPTYTIGDIIGVIRTSDFIVYYKNGVFVVQMDRVGNSSGVILAGRNA